MYSLFSAGAVISALLVAHRSFITMEHIVLGAVALGVSMLLLSLAPNVFVAAPIAFLVGMASILYTTATTTLAQVQAAPQVRGRVLALQTALLAGTTPIGGPILGALADVTSPRIPIIIGGLVCLAAAAFGHISSLKSSV